MPKPLVLDPTTSRERELATGDLTLPADPTTALGAATKQYVDGNLPIDGGNFADTYVGSPFAFDGGAF